MSLKQKKHSGIRSFKRTLKKWLIFVGLGLFAFYLGYYTGHKQNLKNEGASAYDFLGSPSSTESH